MSLQAIEQLVARLAEGRPGLLGWGGFYIALIGLYGFLVILTIVQSIRQARRPAALQGWSWAALLLALSLIHGLLYSVVNPPWFAPDEPPHFEYARLLADLGRVPSTADTSPQLQGEILASMYRFDFWRLNGRQTPDHAPRAFAPGLGGDWQGIPPTFVVDDKFLWYFPQVGNEPPLYYFLVQPAFWPLLSGGDITLQFYWVRWITLLLYVACVVMTFFAGRHVLADTPGGAVGAAVLVTFHPMFSYMGSTANNDLIGAALGTAWFAMAAAIFLCGMSWPRLAVLLGLTVLAAWAKKTTLFVYPLLAVALGLYWLAGRTARQGRRLVLALAAVLVIAAATVAAQMAPDPNRVDAWLSWPAVQEHARTCRQAHDGACSFHLGATSGEQEVRLTQTLPLPSVAELRGQTVVLQARVRGDVPGQRGRLALVDSTGWHTATFVAGPSWQTVSLTYTLPVTNQLVRAALLPGGQAGDSQGAVYLDAVSLHVAGSDRNFLYNGSAERAAPMLRTVILAITRPLGLVSYVVPWFTQQTTDSWRQLVPEGGDFLLKSFWGHFGSLNVPMSPLWQNAWLYLCLIALLGNGVYLVRNYAQAEAKKRAYLGLLAAGLAGIVVEVMLPLFKRPVSHWLPQGRFLFPAIMPIALLLYLGWSRLLPQRVRPWLLPLVVIVAFAMDAAALVTLAAHSYP